MPAESLAEFLGVEDRVTKTPASSPGPSDKLTIKDFCKHVLRSKDYREMLLLRVQLGTLPPAIETLLYHYAEGKPVERVEFKDKTDPLEDFTAEQCQERAMRLLEVARQLRETEESESDERVPGAVH